MAVSIGHLLLHELRRSSLAASSHDSDKRPEAGTGAEDMRVGRSASSSSLEVNREALHGRSRGEVGRMRVRQRGPSERGSPSAVGAAGGGRRGGGGAGGGARPPGAGGRRAVEADPVRLK